MAGEIPNFVYHGTTSEYLDDILKFGIVPGKRKTNFEAISHPQAVFFTSVFDKAKFHAAHTSQRVGGDPVILKMKIPDMSLLIPDYDVDMGAGDTGCYDYICQATRDNTKKYSKMTCDSFSLSRDFGIYGYKGRIPANQIKAYYILMNAEEIGEDVHHSATI